MSAIILTPWSIRLFAFGRPEKGSLSLGPEILLSLELEREFGKGCGHENDVKG